MRERRANQRRAAAAAIVSVVALWPCAAAADGPVPADVPVVVRVAHRGALERLGAVERAVSDDTFVVRGDPAVLAGDPAVRWAAADALYTVARQPDDPCFRGCPVLLGGQRALRTIGAPAAWDVSTGSAGVVVAVVDTAVWTAHPELAGKVTQGPDLRTDPCPAGDPEIASHGTGVAGLVAARTDDHAGIASLGWDTSVLSIPVLDDCGDGTASGVAAGIRAAVERGAAVINISATGPHHPAVQEAVAGAVAAGVAVVAAAGNDPHAGTAYPAGYPGVVGVASTDRDGTEISEWSSVGSWVDIAAPGEHLLSTAPVAGGYWFFSGTSFSAPLVSAAVALTLAARPAPDARAATADVLRAATPLPCGTTGLLDAGAALRAVAPAVLAVTAAGAVHAHGGAAFRGAATSTALRAPVVSVAPGGDGYWLAAADGGVFAFGGAPFHGSAAGRRLTAPVVGIAGDPETGGYWLAAAGGGVFAFGGAPHHGAATGLRLRSPVVAIAGAGSAGGYWLAAAGGGVFAFGGAPFLGAATGSRSPIVALAVTSCGGGYALLARDGTIWTFGRAPAAGPVALAAGERAVALVLPAGGASYAVVTDGGRVLATGAGMASGAIAGPRASPVVAASGG